ncbi:MAG: GAF domain-containing protein [Chloroflexota bacterium]
MHNLVGDSAAALSAFPVAAIGWYFGLGPGIVASLIAAVINSLLIFGFADLDLAAAMNGSLLPGIVILFIVGGGSGRLGQFMQERMETERTLREREHFLSRLNEITASILASQNPAEVPSLFTDEIASLMGADECFFYRWDPSVEQVIPTVTPSRLTKSYREVSFEPGEANLGQSVIRAGRAIGVDDIATSSLVSERLKSQLPSRSLLGIPLLVGDHRVGAVVVAFHTPHTFTEDEIKRAEQVGNLLALALWDVQQDIELQRRLRETNTLAKIGIALSETEHVGLDEVLQLIVDSARELIPDSEKAVIHLLDDDKEYLIPRAVSGHTSPSEGRRNMRLGQGVAGQVIADGTVVNIADVESDPRFLRMETRPDFRSLLVSPVQSGKQRLGTISVQSSLPDAFTADEEALLSALGAQAAIAFENARLLETTQQGYKEISALYHITQGLASSLETEQLMKDVVDLLQQSFGYYHVEILVIDPETEDLVVQHGSGEIGKHLKSERLPAGTGIIGHAAITGEPFFTNDVNQVVFFYPHALLPDTQSELAVPIKVNQHVLGVLDVQQRLPNHLTERDQRLVGTVADQLAIALQKASLYSDLQASLAQEKSMRSQLVQSERLALVGRLLASVSHELNNPLQAIQNALFLLKEEEGISAQGRQDLQIVLSETERMAGLIERLRASYRPTQLNEFQPIQLNTIVEDVYALLATHLRHKRVAFEFHPDPDLPLVSGLPDQLRQVTLNLLMNGVEAIKNGGRLTVSTEVVESGEVMLSVSDTGPGIDPVLLPHIFDAFVTSKESGTGLGLTITYDIVHRHQGRIQAENNPTGGATFKIWLPISPMEQI